VVVLSVFEFGTGTQSFTLYTKVFFSFLSQNGLYINHCFVFVLETTILPLFELKNQQYSDSQMFLTCSNETNGLSFDPQVHILLIHLHLAHKLFQFSPVNVFIVFFVQTCHLFSAGGDSIAYCWDLTTQQCVYTLKGHDRYLHCIKVNSSRHQVLTGSEDSTCRVWG
jgi:WD40 repeat protein